MRRDKVAKGDWESLVYRARPESEKQGTKAITKMF
jgi:hypothetical protein